MQIFVEGPKGGKLDIGLQAYATLAVRSFAKQLGITRLHTVVTVRIHSALTVDRGQSEGLCGTDDGRNFEVDVALHGNWLKNLAHEMVHVKQFARGELDFGLTRWKSNKYCDNIEYWDQPWEKEARRLQQGLVNEFDKY